MLKAAWFVFYVEFVLLLRRSQEWVYPLGFFLIVISLFPLAFSPDTAFLQKYIPGCVWIAALFASLLSIEHVFHTDMEEGHLEQCALGQLPLSVVLFAKLSAQWMVTQLPLILLTPLLGVIFHLSVAAVMALGLGLLFGTPLLTLMGSLGVALTLGLRQQGVLLGMLILPLVTPILIFGVSAVQQAEVGLSMLGPLAFLAGLMVLGLMVLPWAIAGTVRVGLED
jgi:heme exporter protein B